MKQMVSATGGVEELTRPDFFGPYDVVGRGDETLVFVDILNAFKHRTLMRYELCSVPYPHVKRHVLDRNEPLVGEHELPLGYARNFPVTLSLRLRHLLGRFAEKFSRRYLVDVRERGVSIVPPEDVQRGFCTR